MELSTLYLLSSVLVRHLEVGGDDKLRREVQVRLLVSGLHEVVLGDDPRPGPHHVLLLHGQRFEHGRYRLLQVLRSSYHQPSQS